MTEAAPAVDDYLVAIGLPPRGNPLNVYTVNGLVSGVLLDAAVHGATGPITLTLGSDPDPEGYQLNHSDYGAHGHPAAGAVHTLPWHAVLGVLHTYRPPRARAKHPEAY